MVSLFEVMETPTTCFTIMIFNSIIGYVVILVLIYLEQNETQDMIFMIINLWSFVFCTFYIWNLYLAEVIISLPDEDIIKGDIWKKIFWFQCWCMPVFLPPFSLIFICWYVDNQKQITPKAKFYIEMIFMAIGLTFFTITYFFMIYEISKYLDTNYS